LAKGLLSTNKADPKRKKELESLMKEKKDNATFE
jgi:hypothetical protein